jgi:hypothetical protein
MGFGKWIEGKINKDMDFRKVNIEGADFFHTKEDIFLKFATIFVLRIFKPNEWKENAMQKYLDALANYGLGIFVYYLKRQIVQLFANRFLNSRGLRSYWLNKMIF